VVDVGATAGHAAVVKDRDGRAAGGEVPGHGLLADRAGAPGTLMSRLLTEAKQQVADVRVFFAGPFFAGGAVALMLAAGGRTGGAEVWLAGVGFVCDGRISARSRLNWNRPRDGHGSGKCGDNN